MIFFAFIILFVPVSVMDYTKRNTDRYFFYIFFVILSFAYFIFIAGARYGHGGLGDWLNYKIFFNEMPILTHIAITGTLIGKYESGFGLLASTIKLFTSNYIVFFISAEIIVCILLFINIEEYFEYKLISLCLYFSLCFLALDMIMMRQALAVQFFLLSLRYIKNKKIFSYYVCVIFASMMHFSGFVLYPLYFILNRYYKSKNIFIIIGIGVILALARIDITTIFLKFIVNFLNISLIKGRILAYLNGDKMYSVIRVLSITHIEYLIWFTLLMLYRKKMNAFSPYFNIFFNMYIIYGLLLFFFGGVQIVSARFIFYFILSIVFFIPYFIRIFKKQFQLVFLLYCLYIFSATFYTINNSEIKRRFYYNYENYFLVNNPE